MTTRANELRLVLTVRDFERAAAFYRALLGGGEVLAWQSEEGRIVILEAGRATIELVDEAQAARIDGVEVGRRVSGDVRLALGVADSGEAARRAEDAGGTLTNPPVLTPWGSLNARVIAPDGLQVTLFSDAPDGPA